MLYTLKQYMTETPFEIVVYKNSSSKYEVYIAETTTYSNDDTFYHEVGTYTFQRDALTAQSQVFDYMVLQESFSKVSKVKG